MSGMIERVAQACCEAGFHVWPATDGYNDAAEKRAWRKVAKAALKSMRDPTIDQEVAATEDWLCVRAQEDRAAVIWKAMIDAALNEEPAGAAP